jgi:hypothetical protein
MINEQPALEQAIERALEVQSRLWRVAAKDLANAIRAEIVRLMDERDDNAYLAAVAPQPEPPAQPAFAVGDRVQNIEGDMTGTVVSVDNEGFEVLFDGRTKPNPFRLGTKFVEPLMPQSTPERVEWAEYVILYPVGSRVSVYERGNGTIVAHGHVAHIAFDDKDTMVYPAKWESVKPLSEPAPAVLPEGVTRFETGMRVRLRENHRRYGTVTNVYSDKISVDIDLGGYEARPPEDFELVPPQDYEHTKENLDVLSAGVDHTGSVWMNIFNGDRATFEFENLAELKSFHTFIGQALAFKESEMNNGR